jgi:aldehyde:ferredoxin oxidoreductase
MYGYTGKLLFADLTNKTWEARELSEELAKNFIGGPALGAKILYDEMPANTDVFAPESMIGFVSGPTNGTGPFMGGRYTVVSKSPVTGGWNDANSGGNFGPRLRRSGYDAIFVRGISETPVYLLVDNGNVEFRDASHLWGKTTIETENAIMEELGDKRVGIALIGPAGERLSNMAAVMNDTHRAAGRGGSGAVMGSKKLKAVVCRGDFQFELKNKEEVLAINKKAVEWQKGPVAPIFKMFGEMGTGGTYENCVLTSDAGIKNWSGVPSDVTDEQRKAVGAPNMDKLYKKKKYNCNACPLGCGALYEVSGGKWPIKDTGRPEYETMGMFGSMLLNGDAEAVNMCNFLCNEYGFDTISFGAPVAWIMECYNRGIFTVEELDGIDLKWGNAEAIVAISEKICKGEGIGLVLNKATRGAAEHFGKGFECLVNASGIEIPQHDSRWAPGLARTYQYDPTPGRHVKGGLGIMHGNKPPEEKYSFEGTGEKDVAGVVDQEITNAGGYCTFGFGLPPGAKIEFITALTGFEYSPEDQRKLGLRSYTIRHAFNLREGMRRGDFTISDRIVGKPPLADGPLAGVTIDHEKLGDSFFGALGWDLKDAVPTKEFLQDIGGLENVIRDLYG